VTVDVLWQTAEQSAKFGIEDKVSALFMEILKFPYNQQIVG